jgi:putative aldouronate transport system substrate-binding protein
MKRKVIALLLVATLLLSLAACSKEDDSSNSSGSSTDSSSSTDSNSSTDSSTEEAVTDTSEVVTIKYMITGNKPTNGRTEEMLEVLNEKLMEKVNAKLDIYWIEWTDYLTNYNLTLAANDGSVDLVGTATTWLDAWPNAKRGAFLELTEDMLKTNAPQTYAQVPAENWEMSKLDGKIYLMPEDNYAQWINHGFIYRQDWADTIGMTNGVDSWTEMGQYFDGVQKEFGVIPWDVAGSTGGATTISGGWISSHTKNIFIDGLEVPMFYGSLDDYYTIDSPIMTNDTFVEFAKTMKDWSDKGYWREDVLNYSGDTRELFFEGATSVDQHHTETWYGNNFIQMKEKQPEAVIDFFYFGQETKNLVKMTITHGATAVSAASKNPERALMVYDLLRNDEEIYRLFNYGIEGVQYVINDEGKMERPEGYVNETDAIQTNFWWGRNDDLGLKDAQRNYEDYEKLVAEYESFAIEYPYGQLVFDTSNISSYLSNMSNIYATYMPLIAFGKTDNPEATVEEFRSALKAAGYDTVMEELQKQMDAYKAYLGK